MTAAVRAAAEPLYSTDEGLAGDGVGEGLWMNVLFRGTRTEIIDRHWGSVVRGKKSDCPDVQPVRVPEGSTGDGPHPFPGWVCSPAGVAVHRRRQEVFVVPVFRWGDSWSQPQERSCPNPAWLHRRQDLNPARSRAIRAAPSSMSVGSADGCLAGPSCGG